MTKLYCKCGFTANTLTEIAQAASGYLLDIVGIRIVNRSPSASKLVVGIFPDSLSDLATPSNILISPTGGTGSTTYSYRISAVNAKGETLASTKTTIANGVASLDVSHYNIIGWDAVTDAVKYRIYGRTEDSEQYLGESATNSFNDTGSSAYPANDNYLIPFVNTTSMYVRMYPDDYILSSKYTLSDDSKILGMTTSYRLMIASDNAEVDVLVTANERLNS